MHIRTSCAIFPGLYQLTLGHTCRYLLDTPNGAALIDSSNAEQAPDLVARIEQFGIAKEHLRFIFLTHVDPHRVLAVPHLKTVFKNLSVVATSLMVEPLSRFGIKPDKIIVPTEELVLDHEIAIYSYPFIGHTDHSTGYLIKPHNFFIGDEGLGYFRGKDLSAPGGDFDLKQNKLNLQSLENLALNGVGLTFFGSLTGELATGHIKSIVQNVDDIAAAVINARADGITEEEISSQIKAAFYATTSTDPIVLASMENSYHAILKQITN